MLAPQDVLFFDEESCCGDGVASEDYSPIIANEIGAEKSELLKWLVQQYISLFPDGEPKPIPKNVVDVENEKQNDFVYEVDILKLENIKDAVEAEKCKPYSEWRVFRFRDIEGITLIRNVFSEEHQLLWAQRCIQVKFQ